MPERLPLALGLRRRLPLIRQTEAAECGLACIAMLLGYHGHHAALAALRRRFPMSLNGASLARLIDVAAELGLASRPLRIGMDELGRVSTPCMLHWNFTHFVVLKAVRRRHIELHDPAAGGRRVSYDEASRAFTGVALEVWPGESFARLRPAPVVRVRDLAGRVHGLGGALLQVVLLALAIEVFVLISPLFLQWVVDEALVTGNRDLLTTLALGFGLAVVLRHAITMLRAWVIMHVAATLNLQWRGNAFAHLLRLPLAWFEKRHLGDIVSRFRSIDVIERTLTTAFVEAVVDGLMGLVVLLVLLLYSPALTAVCGAATLAYLLCRACLFGPARRASEEHIVKAAHQESHFLESVRGARAIRLFDRARQRRAAWLGLLVEQLNAGLRGRKLEILQRLVNGLLFGLENVVVVYVGARLVLAGQFSAGMLIAFLAYKDQFATRAAALIDRGFELRMLRVQAERVADVLLAEPEAAPAAAAAGPDKPGIRLRGVRFRYAAHEPWVLDGVDLDVAPGEAVAIVGPSGCGKSTLVHVMLGIVEPTEGRVTIGGDRGAATGPPAARSVIGAVTQGDVLFAGTIADNISFFDAQADQARIEDCARRVAIDAEIRRMPMGYNTFVGFMGTSLSGGQQQCLLLARALYRRPRILILDEATSHVDVERERCIAAALARLEITRVIVAHRPEAIRHADRVVVLEHGRVARRRVRLNEDNRKYGPIPARRSR